jgi:hypothetical protein
MRSHSGQPKTPRDETSLTFAGTGPGSLGSVPKWIGRFTAKPENSLSSAEPYASPNFLVGLMVTQLPHQTRATGDLSHDDLSISFLDYVAKLVQEMELHHRQQCEQRTEALDRLIDAKFVTLQTVIDAHARNAVLALAAADKAVSKAELATEKRFESVNEFRATLSDQTRTFVSRIEFDAVREATATRIVDLSSRLDKTDGKSVGLNTGWVYLLGVVAVAGTLASIALAVLFRTG